MVRPEYGDAGGALCVVGVLILTMFLTIAWTWLRVRASEQESGDMIDTNVLHTERGDISVTDGEMALYRLLSEDPTRAYTIETISRRLGMVMPDVVRNARTLRAKFRELDYDRIEPIWGVGYRLNSTLYNRTGVHS